MSDFWTPTDPLGEALHVLRMRSGFYSRGELTAPWGLVLPPIPETMMFHIVLTGDCWLDVDDLAPRRLRPGDMALVPHGAGHQLVSVPGVRGVALRDTPREDISARYEILRAGGGGERTELLCGVIQFDHPAALELTRLLPPVIHVDTASAMETDWLRGTLRLIITEAQALRPGGETMITRLADVLVIQAIRSWIERDPAAQKGWLGALRDPKIGGAIAKIHREPARAWTVDNLATEAIMSRSAFAARFTALVGESPMHYVTRWRMQIAQSQLMNDDVTLGEIAASLGYGSEAAFSRAFKRFTGFAPGSIRRANVASPRLSI